MIVRKCEQHPETLPLLAMRGLVLFPEIMAHCEIRREQSVSALAESMQKDQTVFLVTQRDMRVESPQEGDLYSVGVIAKVRQILRAGENAFRIAVEGISRARLLHILQDEPYISAQVIPCPTSSVANTVKKTALLRSCQDLFSEYVDLDPRFDDNDLMPIRTSGDISFVADYIAYRLPLSTEEQEQVLSCIPISKRVEIVLRLLERECAVMRVERTIQDRVQDQVEQNQKEYYLREQMRAIAEELGEADDPLEESDEYREKIQKLSLPPEVAEKFLEETDKLAKMPYGSHEATVVRNYLDTALSLPWGVTSTDKTDLERAERLLNREHYGMEKIKERVLELMAVWQLTGHPSGQVLCLAGPPGVGKTSVARSVARAMGRKYVRVSLGGVRDEADIRGHRKTYVGAMMGRIMTAIRQAGTSNPLILLDEVDKLGNDLRGDPASALLEALDTEQNSGFVDHFLEVPFDLSRVLFITTANDVNAIPQPLYDRMDVLEMGSYTAEEKFQIAKRHLVKKQLKLNGLNAKQLHIPDKSIRGIIEGYTREAGVRQLERCIGKICRQAAKKIVSKEEESVTVKDLAPYLGPVKYKSDETSHGDAIGLVNGLAWTSVGGEMLPIEVAILEGTGKVELTGSLGDVMKESARLAISYVRSRAGDFDVPLDFYRSRDIHLHAPEGAVPKDGPSAGAAMTTAILSALAEVPVRGNLAMTGELSLRGRVLPIGGLKEKLMAAYTHHMQTVLIPKGNMPDLDEVDQTVKNGLNIIPVEHMDEVIRHSLVKAPVKTGSVPAAVSQKPQRRAGKSADTRARK